MSKFNFILISLLALLVGFATSTCTSLFKEKTKVEELKIENIKLKTKILEKEMNTYNLFTFLYEKIQDGTILSFDVAENEVTVTHADEYKIYINLNKNLETQIEDL